MIGMVGNRKILFSGSGINRKTGERIKFRISSRFTDVGLALMEKNVEITEIGIHVGEGEDRQPLDSDSSSFKSDVLNALNEEGLRGEGKRYYRDDELELFLKMLTPEDIATMRMRQAGGMRPMSIEYFMVELMDFASQDTVDSLKRLHDKHPTPFETIGRLDVDNYRPEDVMRTFIEIVKDLSIQVDSNDIDLAKVSSLAEAYIHHHSKPN